MAQEVLVDDQRKWTGTIHECSVARWHERFVVSLEDGRLGLLQDGGS